MNIDLIHIILVTMVVLLEIALIVTIQRNSKLEEEKLFWKKQSDILEGQLRSKEMCNGRQIWSN